MALSIFHARVIQKYRNQIPKWYDFRGHRGVDLAFYNETLESPITGVVRQTTLQKEMGKCIYIVDALGNTHVFAHMSRVDVVGGQHVTRGQKIGITGNTGTVTSGAHLHYEVITQKPVNLIDRIMTRTLMGVKGYNTDPQKYLIFLYNKYGVPIP